MAAAFGIGSGLTWQYQKPIILWLLAPAHGGLSPTGLPTFTGLSEMFDFVMRLSLIGGAVVAFPVLLFHLYRLTNPLMSRGVRRFVLLFAPVVLLFFLAGAAFAYYVLLPVGIRFMLALGDGVAIPMIRVSDYMDVVIAMSLWMGLVFETPIIMWALARLRIVSYKQFNRVHPWVPTFAFVVGLVIAPAFDGISQVLIPVPLIVLYELGLLLAYLARPRTRRVS